jgi:Thermostable hemolysin
MFSPPTPTLAVAHSAEHRYAPAAPRLRVHGPDDAGRGEVERFIQGVFRQRYGAEVRQFAPQLVSLRDADGELVAAAGYRGADDGPLFLERYLGAPAETLLAGAGGTPRRAHIAEVGHLAAGRAGEGRRLVLLLGPHLAAQGYRWVVSTLTEELRHLFLRLGIAPLSLGAADPALLGADAERWGSYYDHHPVVLAGQIDLALKALARRGLGTGGQAIGGAA